jgi:RNA polymerase sigma-70 factor (ECF subfamily)
VISGADPTCLSVEGSIGCVTDEELVLLARQGDTSAFDELVVRHQGAVYRAALSALRIREDAEEVTQDAFMRAWSGLRRFRGDSSFKTWVLTIVWRRAISRRRSIANWWRSRTRINDSAPIEDPCERTDYFTRDRELRGHIVEAIEALSPKLRDALLLAQAGEYEYEEIGAMLRVTAGTVKWRVSEARRRIRTRLAGLGYVDAR